MVCWYGITCWYEWVAVSLPFVRNPVCAAVLDSASYQGAPEACRGHEPGSEICSRTFVHEMMPPARKRGRIPRSSAGCYSFFHLHGRFRQKQRRLFRRFCPLRVRPMIADNSKSARFRCRCCRTVTPNAVISSLCLRVRGLLIATAVCMSLLPCLSCLSFAFLVAWPFVLEDGRVTYTSETGKGKQKKEALLNDSDALWAEFRHKHIGKVLTDLGMLQRYSDR